MKITSLCAFNFEGAFRGMRNPMNSWSNSDSVFCPSGLWYIGEKDLTLAQKLINAGGEHRKFLRQIIVSFDLTAPLYFWKEFDTYKIGTVSNSTSTMHKLATTTITLDCFELDDYEPELIYLSGIDDSGDYSYKYDMQIRDMVESDGLNTYYEPSIIQFLEELRRKYNETKDKKYWKELIRWLPESWLQTRTITMNYENVLNIKKVKESVDSL